MIVVLCNVWNVGLLREYRVLNVDKDGIIRWFVCR